MIEHDMSLAMSLCQFLYVLDFGAVLAAGAPDAVRANPAVVEAYLGTEVA
jgi:branched-chain amino acid transport system ATP-binding protein